MCAVKFAVKLFPRTQVLLFVLLARLFPLVPLQADRRRTAGTNIGMSKLIPLVQVRAVSTLLITRRPERHS